jgi:hypothetical protein
MKKKPMHGKPITGKMLGAGAEEGDNPKVKVGKTGKMTNGHSHNAHPPKMHRGSAMHVPPIKKDNMIDSSHAEMQKKHGMGAGFAPDDGYENMEDAGGEGNETHD